MKLNHINLTVTDIPAATDFLVRYFGMRDLGGNNGMGFLTDHETDYGFVLTLMKASEGTQSRYPATFHIGFFVESEDVVNAVHRRLKADDFDVPEPEQTGHSYGFYVKAPGGFTVELGA